MELIQSKSLLAKLMATENLIVEQRNVRTASFDIANRVLTIPVLDKNISGWLYDLLVGHEVGHALWTNEKDYLKGRETKLSKSVLNIIEDARIEKKIKNKYPGIRLSFVKGYKELIEKDFFGTAGVNLNDLNFIDRVNLYTKGGPTQGIKFTVTEMLLVKRIELSETYDDVIAIARDVGEYMQEEEEEKRRKNSENEEFEEPEEEEDNEDDYDNDYGDDEDEDGGDDEDDGGKPEDEGEDGDRNDEGGLSGAGKQDPLRSHTQEAFHKNEDKLYANNNRQYYYGNIPDIDLKEAIMGYKEVWKKHREAVKEKQDYWNQPEFTGTDLPKFLKIREDAKKVVGYLAKEFELRKNAEQSKRTSTAKTGELNMNKIYSYTFNEDLFKKMTIVPNGKSHGLVMFIDWSGSMTDHIENTIKQLINLCIFCKKVNIPFDVYAFTSEGATYYCERIVGDMNTQAFKLMNLLSSKMSASEFTYACSALVKVNGKHWMPDFMYFGGTPLTEAIISAMKIIPEFQKNYKLQVVNTVFLTDGDGQSVSEVFGVDKPYVRSSTTLVIRDPISKHEEYVDNPYGNVLTSAYIKLLKSRTQCNIVGFYVLSAREFNHKLHVFFPPFTDFARIKSQFRSNKYCVVTSAGFDEYYLLRSQGLDTDEDAEFVVKENSTTRGLVSAFSKYAGNRLSNRVVLNRFIGMIA